MTSDSEQPTRGVVEDEDARERKSSKSSKKKHHHRSRSRSSSRERNHRSSRKRSERSVSRERRDHERSESPFDGRAYQFRKNRNIPEPNKCLGVFGLSTRTTEKDLINIFSKYGHVESCTVVVHGQTGRSRGFSFVYFNSVADATAAKEACNGMEIDGCRVRVDYSITQRAHTPTPGIYMGKIRYEDRYFRRRRNDGRSYHRRSPSPFRRHRPRYSRSRSRSPRRYHNRR